MSCINRYQFKELYLAIYRALKELECNSNVETSKTVFQLSSTLSASNLVIFLHVLENIFVMTLPLCTSLQKINTDLCYCHERVEDVRKILIDKRNNSDKSFKNIFSDYEKAMFEGDNA